MIIDCAGRDQFIIISKVKLNYFANVFVSLSWIMLPSFSHTSWSVSIVFQSHPGNSAWIDESQRVWTNDNNLCLFAVSHIFVHSIKYKTTFSCCPLVCISVFLDAAVSYLFYFYIWCRFNIFKKIRRQLSTFLLFTNSALFSCFYDSEFDYVDKKALTCLNLEYVFLPRAVRLDYNNEIYVWSGQ